MLITYDSLRRSHGYPRRMPCARLHVEGCWNVQRCENKRQQVSEGSETRTDETQSWGSENQAWGDQREMGRDRCELIVWWRGRSRWKCVGLREFDFGHSWADNGMIGALGKWTVYYITEPQCETPLYHTIRAQVCILDGRRMCRIRGTISVCCRYNEVCYWDRISKYPRHTCISTDHNALIGW